MLRVSNLTISYSDLLFKQLTFSLGNSEKVGLIGLNGCGKSTLLKLIMGIETPDDGEVSYPNERIGYLPQEFHFKEGLLVGEHQENVAEECGLALHQVQKHVGKLGLNHIDEFTEVDTLSPGLKMKLYLLKIVAAGSTILLLDEPTNHLDIEGIIWLEKYLNSYPGICIIISHDRDFLNNVIDKVFEIDERALYIYEGNYDMYLHQKELFKLERAKQFELHAKKKQQLEKLLESARKIRDGKKRGKAVDAAKARINRELDDDVSKYTQLQLKGLNLHSSVHNRKRIIKLNQVEFAYPNSESILKEVDLEMYGSQKIWLRGANGIGKTTLIQMMIGNLIPNSGEIIWGENIRWRYFSQEQSHLPEEALLADYFISATGVSYHDSFKILGKFLFPKEMRNHQLKKLSPGQRARLSFAIFSQEQNDCLILDEPTNHLDINTKSVIQHALSSFPGAIILVSHDRSFAREIKPDRILTIEDQHLVQYRE